MDENTKESVDSARDVKPSEELSPEQAVDSLQQELSQLNDKYLRLAAEFENSKRRAQKERSDLIKYAGENLIRDLLDVFDSLKLSVKQDTPAEAKGFVDGVKKILQQFEGVLIKHSIKTYASKGEQFDPSKHEAISTVPTADYEPGTILQEFKSLFFYKDKLIRPAQVVVAKEDEGNLAEEE